MLYYINKKENVLEKYEVVYDKKQLEDLLMRVILNCGERHKRIERSAYDIPENSSCFMIVFDYNKDNIKYLEDIQSHKNGKTATLYEDNYYPYEVDLYNCEYIEYIAPYFAGFISGLIYHRDENFLTLLNKDFSNIKHFPTVQEKIDKLNSKIIKLKSDYVKNIEKGLSMSGNHLDHETDYNKLKDVKELFLSVEENDKIIKEQERELERLLKLQKYNLNQEPITKYVHELDSLVEFKLIDTIDLNEIDRVNTFLSEPIMPQNTLVRSRK